MIEKKSMSARCAIVTSTLLSLSVLIGCSGSSDVMVASIDESASVDMSTGDETPSQTEPTEQDTNTTPAESPAEMPEQNIPDVPAEVDIGEGSRLIERAGQLYITHNDGPTGLEITASAQFYRLVTPLEDAPQLRVQEGLDSCEVSSVASQLNADALAFPIEHLLESQSEQAFQVTPTLIGDSIDISSDSGSYAMLNVVETENNAMAVSVADKDYQMQTGADLTTALPVNLNISVSGADFPLQWSWVTPDLLPISLRDDIRQVGTNPEIVWQSAEQSDARQSRVMIYAGAIDELTGAYRSYECSLQDDGSFVMPDEIRDLYADGFSPNFVDVARYTRTLQTIDDVSIVNVFVQHF